MTVQRALCGAIVAALAVLRVSTATAANPAPLTAEQVIASLSDPDPDVRNRATDDLQDLPVTDLPKLEAAAARADLSPEAQARLQRVMPAVRQRAKLADRTARKNRVFQDFYEREAIAELTHGSGTRVKWYPAAVAGIHAIEARWTLDGDAHLAANRQARTLYDAALAAGCDDPTFLACGGLMLADTGATDEAVHDAFVRADRSAANGGAGPLFKVIIDGRMLRPAEGLSLDDRRKQWPALMARLHDMATQFERLLTVDHLTPEVAVASASNIYDRSHGLGASVKPFLECAMTPLEKAFPNDPGVLVLKGRAYIDWAWEARGGGWANSVTPQGWKDFADRLVTANAALSRAWDLDHDDVDAPTLMLTVGLGQGWDRPTMDRWYERALAASPDDDTAAKSMLYYLEPKWYGSPEAMVEFGRACLAAGNYRSFIPTVVVDAHWRVAENYSGNAPHYWLQSGVWDDIQSVYRHYMARYPDDDGYRNKLAYYATLCHQWKVADEQFTALGDRAEKTWYGNKTVEAFEEVRKNAALLAGQPDAQGK